MQALLLQSIVKVLLMTLTPDKIRDFADMALDFVENQVLGSASKVDDRLVLPLCDAIRAALSIPDGDD